jgi:integrase
MGYSSKTTFKKVDLNRWIGVYFRESEERRTKGNLDVCYYITYKKKDASKKGGYAKVWEKIGWKSEGYSPQVASGIRADRQRIARHGGEVKTAKDIQREKVKNNRALDEIANAYFAQRGGSAQAAKFDRYRYDKHVSPLLGKKTIASISPADVDRIKKTMLGKAPATVWGALELIRRFANFGRKNGLSLGLSFVIEMPKLDNEVVEYLEPDEMVRLLGVLKTWPAQDVARMLRLAMFSGLRRGEVFKLENQDIDFTLGLITLRTPKGGKTCSIPMNPVLESILREQITWRDQKYPDSTFLFPGRYGGLRVDSSAVKRIKQKANLPKSFRIFHGLRHHYAVTLANSGEFTLDMIGELLTHKDTAMTKRYAQFLPGTKRVAANRAADILQGQMVKNVKIDKGKK